MIQGTTSQAGTSLIVAGLCGILREKGLYVAPFSSQNMTKNTYIADSGKEMSRIQAVQAVCAGARPDVRMNPVLLKPTDDRCSDVIVDGELVGNMTARQYGKHCLQLVKNATDAYESLCSEFNVVVIEGAGSPVEISLKQKNPLINMELAKAVKAPVIMVGDIDRGGVIASLLGTGLLLDEDEKELFRGIIINKFVGDISELELGIDVLETTVGKPVVGVVPYIQNSGFDQAVSSNLESTLKPNISEIENAIKSSVNLQTIYRIAGLESLIG